AIRESVEIVMQLMNLVGLGDRMPHQLSGGQQQRVSLARALVMQPKVLLFDEPLSNLDAKLRVQMRVEIRRLQQRLGITTVYVTHDQAEAMSLSNRIVIMHNGQIEQIGTPSEIYQHPASLFVADFIGRANFIESTVQDQTDGQMTFDLFGCPLTLPASRREFAAGEPVYLVIRPESVRLSRQEGRYAGEVKQMVYLGSTVEYEVETHDQFIAVVVYDPQQGDIFEEGSRVFLDLPSDAFHVLPRLQVFLAAPMSQMMQ
ncbi:MAG: ABC transporter ATP-binding protein, partial [Chloroflexi bacterium]|nr:ABC transporter ATP-binding protein [Chloroflexota bacterium]